MNTQKQDRMQGNTKSQQNQGSDKKPGQQNQQGQKPNQQGGAKSGQSTAASDESFGRHSQR